MDSSWVIMDYPIYSGKPWYPMIIHDEYICARWMVFLVTIWLSSHLKNPWWIIMGYHGFIMDYHGLSWIIMDYPIYSGKPWYPMIIHDEYICARWMVFLVTIWLSSHLKNPWWIIMGYHGFIMDYHGLSHIFWKTMISHDNPWWIYLCQMDGIFLVTIWLSSHLKNPWWIDEILNIGE